MPGDWREKIREPILNLEGFGSLACRLPLMGLTIYGNGVLVSGTKDSMVARGTVVMAVTSNVAAQ